MISKTHFSFKKNGQPNAKCFCADYTKIENYDKAIADKENVWVCHHRWETNDPNHLISTEELKEAGMYYNVPAFDLIFLRNEEHTAMHNKIGSREYKPLSNERKAKSGSSKGKKAYTLNGKRIYIKDGEPVPEGAIKGYALEKGKLPPNFEQFKAARWK